MVFCFRDFDLVWRIQGRHFNRYLWRSDTELNYLGLPHSILILLLLTFQSLPAPIHPRDHPGIGPFKKIWQNSISQRRDTVPKCWQWGGWCYLTGRKVTLSSPSHYLDLDLEVQLEMKSHRTTCTPREAGLSCCWLVPLSEHKSHVNPQRKQAKQDPLAESREEPNRLFQPFPTTASSKGEGNSKLSMELTHTLSIRTLEVLF